MEASKVASRMCRASRILISQCMKDLHDSNSLEVEERVRKGAKCSFFFTLNRDSRPQAHPFKLGCKARLYKCVLMKGRTRAIIPGAGSMCSGIACVRDKSHPAACYS